MNEILNLRQQLLDAKRIIHGFTLNEAWYYRHLIEARKESAELSKHLAALTEDYDALSRCRKADLRDLSMSRESVIHLTKVVRNQKARQKALTISDIVAHGKSLAVCHKTIQELQDEVRRLEKKAKAKRPVLKQAHLIGHGLGTSQKTHEGI